MAQAKLDDTVKVHYTGKLDDGTVFDTSENREPLQFKIGEKKLIPGFEEAVIGLEVGQSKTINIPSDEAYGPHRKEMVFQVNRSDFPENVDLKIGQQFQMQQKEGRAFVVTIMQIVEDKVVLDANHPLAGKDINFEIKLIEII